MNDQPLISSSSLPRPPLLVSVPVCLVLVLGMGCLRLQVYPHHVVPLAYPLLLLVALWHRDRRLLWGMAVLFMAMSSYNMHIALPQRALDPVTLWVFWAMQMANIVVAAGVLHRVLDLLERTTDQAHALARGNEQLCRINAELEASNEELASREEEIARQNEELRTQTEELQTQSEELAAVNANLSHREATLNALLDLAQPGADESELLQSICSLTPGLIGSKACAAAIMEDRGDHFEIVAQCGFGKAGPRTSRVPRQEAVASLFLERGRSGFIADLRDRPDLQVAQPRDGEPFRTALVAPLFAEGQPRGTLEVYCAQPRQWTLDEGRILEWLAFQGARIWQATRLRQQRQRAEHELRQLNQELERRVAERTAEAEYRARQLSRLASELAQTEQRERQRLAQVLHDHLQQLLVATKMQLDLSTRHNGHRNLARPQALLQEAIDLSRSLTVELSPPILHSGDFAGALHWLARHMQEKHNLSVTVHAQRDLPLSDVQRFVFFQAARELLFNVVKHAGVDAATLYFHEDEQDRLRLIVEDRGKGINPAHVNRPNDRFGLFSVRERVTVLGGEMTMQSNGAQGTRVVITLPRMERGDAEPSREQMEVQAGGGETTVPDKAGDRIRVLIADDHQIIRDGLSGILQEQPDIELIGAAADGQEAIELARSLRPDVVVMDVNMPRVNGVDATRQITQDLPATRVIGLSMHPRDDLAGTMRQAGAVAYLSKDDAARLLLAEIRAAMAGAPGR